MAQPLHYKRSSGLALVTCIVGRIIPMATPNALFVIFAVSDAEAIGKRLQAIAPWLYLNVGEGEWLVIAPAATTTKEVSDRIGLGVENPIASGIVVRGDSYFGRASQSIWEWIATKQGAALGTTAANA